MAGTITTAALLEGGALLDPTTKTPKGAAVDMVSVRAYRHPALGERKVVRLTPEALAPGDDLEMEFLGFDAPVVTKKVAKQRRRALGFPGWALIHDPKHARYALEVVKELKKHARRARTKPGHAKAGFDEIADRLSRSVPHFLPSYYEEVGRVFLLNGNNGYAAQAFGKARDAERVHALEVDEDLRMQTFLEFALAGAVTNKEVGKYAKSLESTLDPETAYRHFRELAIKRTLGGMPPWSGMAKELRRLAKAAELDPKQEDRRLLAEIIEAPSLVRAPADFWQSYDKALVAACEEEPSWRGHLLNLHPRHAPAAWLDLLQRCRALDAVEKAGPAEAAPRGGAAAWMSKFINDLKRDYSHRFEAPAALFELLERVAPRLVREGEPLQLGGSNHYVRYLDIDLCERALELGVTLAPGEQTLFFVNDWAKLETSDHRPRDPVRVAAHDELGPKLEEALGIGIGQEPFDTVSMGMEGFVEIRRRWLAGWLDKLGKGGLPDVTSALEVLESRTDARTFAPYPELYAQAGAASVAPALAQTLRIGLLDELGWPAWEESAAALDPDGKAALTLSGSFPYAVVANEVEAHVVGPEGRCLEHSFRLPKDFDLQMLRWVGGELLVAFRSAGNYKTRAYFSGTPKKILEVESYLYGALPMGELSVDLPDGSTTFGGKAVAPGSLGKLERETLFHDGETFWTSAYHDGKWAFWELDPVTGKRGRASLPAFLEDFVADDTQIDRSRSLLVPLPSPALASTPLGTKDGMLGFRVRSPQFGTKAVARAEGIDGRAFDGHVGGEPPIALVTFPGDDRPRPIGTGYAYGGDYHYAVYDPEGRYRGSTLPRSSRDYAEGSPGVPHITFWHYLVPRDEEGSKALRSVSEEVCTAIVADAAEGIEGLEERADRLAAVASFVGKHLPAVTHPRLVRGVAGVTLVAAELGNRLAKLVANRDPAKAKEASAALVSEQTMRSAVAGLLSSTYGSGEDALAPLRTVKAFFETGEAATLPSSVFGWPALLTRDRALAYRAAAPGATDETRAALVATLRAWAPLARMRATLRLIRRPALDGKWPVVGRDRYDRSLVIAHGDSRYAVTETGGYDDRRLEILEHAPEGAFDLGPDAPADCETFASPDGPSGDDLEALATLIEERGPMTPDPAFVDHVTEQTGMTAGEAWLLWAGLPGFDSWDANFLDKELRTAMGMKVREASAAKQALSKLTDAQRAELLGAMIPDDPAKLYEAFDGSDDHPARRLAEAYKRVVGERVSVPEELVVACTKALPSRNDATTVLTALAAPDDAKILNADTASKLTDGWDLVEPAEPGCFGTYVLGSLVSYALYINEMQPVGDPIRAQLPAVLAKLRERLANEELLVVLQSTYTGEEDKKEVFDAFEGKTIDVGKDTKAKEAEALVVVWSKHRIGYLVRPAKVKDFDDPKIVGLDSGYNDFGVVRQVAKGRFDAVAARIEDTPVPKGQHEANPVASVPELVAKVAGACGVSEDAAGLYLQLLALRNPTTKWLRAINGWTAGRYEKAAAELVKAELVLKAKRARAGRSHFLPGGWEALKAPHAPIESWKLPLYDIDRDAEGKLRMPLGFILPLDPIHRLFERAWERVEAGDAPRYEEVS